MNSWITRTSLAAALAVAATGAFAQAQSTNRVGANTDWSVFVESNPKECWSVSSPKETVNSRGGRVVAARKRSDILLFVFNRPGIRGDGPSDLHRRLSIREWFYRQYEHQRHRV